MESFNKAVLWGIALIFSLPALLYAGKLPDATLDMLSAEASETVMKEQKTEQELSPEPAVAPSEGADVDSLSRSVVDQLSGILGQAGSDASGAETEQKLEKVVSRALLGGIKMDELRTAVDAAMDEIGMETAEEEASNAEIRQATEALKKLVSQEEDSRGDSAKDSYLESLRNEVKAFGAVVQAIESNPEAGVPASDTETGAIDQDRLETVTVLAGESLYKIALRVYGEGDMYLRLYEANKDNISNPNIVQVGQVLKVPRGENQ